MDQKKRGRWGQYKLMSANEAITPYLLKTELLNEDSLFRYLQQSVTIRPCFGTSKIDICKIPGDEEQYRVTYDYVTTTLNEKKEILTYLNKVCKPDQFYILQDTNFLHTKYNQVLELAVTVQRDVNFIWHVNGILNKNEPKKNDNINELTLKRIRDVANQTANCIMGDAPNCTTVVLDLGLLGEQLWIDDIELHFSKSKWSQYQLLTFIEELTPYLPNTQIATPGTFLHFIKKYKQIILKPCSRQWGIGVVQISRLKRNVFQIHHEKSSLTINGETEIISYLQNHFLNKQRYIVQQRVKLAEIEQSVFDTRVMVQRDDSNSEWEVTAKVAKVAANDYIITNIAKSIIPLEDALEKAAFNKRQFLNIDRVCTVAAQTLGEYYPHVTRIGFDIGIDKKGDIWIIEANLVPDVLLFKRLKDPSIYEKITKKKKRK